MNEKYFYNQKIIERFKKNIGEYRLFHKNNLDRHYIYLAKYMIEQEARIRDYFMKKDKKNDDT